MAKTADLNVEVDQRIKRRLKVYSVVTGEPMKSIVSRLLDEKLPRLPAESEAPA